VINEAIVPVVKPKPIQIPVPIDIKFFKADDTCAAIISSFV
jgi:hypothetical protein